MSSVSEYRPGRLSFCNCTGDYVPASLTKHLTYSKMQCNEAFCPFASGTGTVPARDTVHQQKPCCTLSNHCFYQPRFEISLFHIFSAGFSSFLTFSLSFSLVSFSAFFYIPSLVFCGVGFAPSSSFNTALDEIPSSIAPVSRIHSFLKNWFHVSFFMHRNCLQGIVSFNRFLMFPQLNHSANINDFYRVSACALLFSTHIRTHS